MTLYTGSIRKKHLDDKVRICVTGRLTEDDGQTPVTKLVNGQGIDYWAKILAPPPKLVGSYFHKQITLKELFAKYKRYLNQERVKPHVRMLAYMARDMDIILLCSENDAKKCHRSILADECARYQPGLKVAHL